MQLYNSYVTAGNVGGEPGDPREEQLQAPGQGGRGVEELGEECGGVWGGGGGAGD